MKANQAVWPVRTVCRVLGLSPSGYYAWVGRAPSARARRDQQLQEQIKELWDANRQGYGRPRIHAELQESGQRVSAKRVGRLMQRAGIAGASRRRQVQTTTRVERAARVAPDLVQRDFTAAGADRLWVADITYVPTWSGFLYLAVVLDAWSRRVVGWSMATHLRTQLVLGALDMAIWQRRPRGVVHHSDQGSQYPSIAFGVRCQEADVRPSTGTVGDAYEQRAVRELLRDPGVRVAGSSPLSRPCRGALGGVRVHRGLLQPTTETFGAGLPVAGRLRGRSERREGNRMSTAVVGEPGRGNRSQ